MNKIRRVRANIVFIGDPVSDIDRLSNYKELEDLIIEEFLVRRNSFIEAVNPLYEQWNEEFDCVYSKLDRDDKAYKRFLAGKYYTRLRAVNTLNVFPNIVRLCCDYENDPAGLIHGYVEGLGLRIYLKVSNK